MPEKHYFTAREIDALTPQLEQILDHIQTCKTRAEELAAQAFGFSESVVPTEVANAQVLRSQVQFLVDAINEYIRHIQTLGGFTKDFDNGLIDFLGDVDGQDVWLCWKRGEPRVRFWHPLDGGYSQRRTLPQSQTNTTQH